MFRRAFTLIEILVVIAIIAILAAILFPVFAQAKIAAKKTADLSNCKQIGTSIYMYLNDNDDSFMSAYFYNNGLNGNAGVYAWSAATFPYIKSNAVFVSPGSPVGGWAPANFTGNNSGAGYPAPQVPGTIQDVQPPRISYTANLLILPRKRKPTDTASNVNSSQLDSVSDTILVAPQTDNANCLVTSSTVYKSYRTGAAVSAIGQAPFQGDEDSSTFNALEAMTPTSANNTFYGATGCIMTKGYDGVNNSSVRFISPNRFNVGGNFVFADSSAKYYPFNQTIDPLHYRWGKLAYSFDNKPIYQPGTTTNVQ